MTITPVVMHFLCLCLCCVGCALAITADEAARRTEENIAAYENGTRIVEHIFDTIHQTVKHHTNTDWCIRVHTSTLRQYGISQKEQAQRTAESPEALEKRLVRTTAARWEKAKQLLVGYTMTHEYLSRHVVPDERPVYMDQRDSDGRVVRQELACTNGARPEGNTYYGVQTMHCVQEPRIELCWGPPPPPPPKLGL